MRRILALALLGALGPAALAAQSSQFGVRGPGLPGRQQSAHALSMGGADASFDPESALNPASLAAQTAFTATFTLLSDFRSTDTPAGSASQRETRFPLLVVATPIKGTRVVAAVGVSNYTNRDFSIVSADTIAPRGVPLAVSDTTSSRGGMSDLRLALAWRGILGGSVGISAHALTGNNRTSVRRVFADTNYLPVAQRAELSYAGAGVTVGIVRPLGRNVTLAGSARWDGRAKVERDSAGSYEFDLPWTFTGAVRARLSPRVTLAGQASWQSWGSANGDLVAAGGVGANDAWSLGVGAEVVRNLRRTWRWPLRVGARVARLPFPVAPGEAPKEYGVSAGTGIRFAQQRAGLDLSLEKVWRSAGSDRKESAWLAAVGVTLRP